MSLVSNEFLLFVAGTLVLYYIVPGRVRWVVLLLASYLYYLAGGAGYVVFILFSTVVTFLAARRIEAGRQAGYSVKSLRRIVGIALFCNLGMLCLVKYTGLFSLGLHLMLGERFPADTVLFPLGISFFTFQSSGYLLDVYWGKAKAESNLFRYALFVSFFPQLLQGPIGNFGRLHHQLIEPHRFERARFARGLERILWGYAKKMILADWAGVFADAIWADPERYGGICLLGLVFYGIQLYGDFSGAMDVVIGTAQLFGIRMDENFRRPYLAASMADFWKRWHITLGEWMMNYVFYPLLLSRPMTRFTKWSRKTFGRKQGRLVPIALADVIVFIFVGLWHGASVKYLVYGLLNGGIIAFSELMGGRYAAMKRALRITGREKWYHVFSVVRTFLIVNFRWFFDRSDTLRQGCFMIRQAFTHFNPMLLMDIEAGREGTAFVPQALCIIAVSCAVMVAVGVAKEAGIDVRERIDSKPAPLRAAIYVLMFLMIGLFGSTASPRGFLYAQF